MATNPSRWLSEPGGVIFFQSSLVPSVNVLVFRVHLLRRKLAAPPEKKTPATASDRVTTAVSFLTHEARSPSLNHTETIASSTYLCFLFVLMNRFLATSSLIS